MSTIAHEIMNTAADSIDADALAQAAGASLDQDWAHEATLYQFDDGSVLTISGPFQQAYSSAEKAREALEA